MLLERGTPDVYGLKLFILEITAEAVSYGIFLTVGTISVYNIIQKGIRDSPARQVLLALIIIMLLGATAHLGLHLPYMILQLPSMVGESEEDASLALLLKRINIGQTAMRRIIYFMSDAIVVWRAWTLYRDNIIVRSMLALFLLVTLATSATLYGFNVNTTMHGHIYPTLTQNFLGTFGLLVTNFTATALIGYKLWYYRRNLKEFLNRGNRATKVESVLVLLIESGGLYCAFWILLMVGDFGYYGDFGFEWLQPNISGIYPTIIILLVSQRKMLADDMFTYNKSGTPNVRLGTLQLGLGTGEDARASQWGGGAIVDPPEQASSTNITTVREGAESFVFRELVKDHEPDRQTP